MLTIWLAHVTLYGLCGSRYFVASAGTGSLDRSSDGSRCDAAESVFRHYATDDHARDHFWLVTGLLSLDDVVIASFVCGRSHHVTDAGLFQRADGGKYGNQRPGNVDSWCGQKILDLSPGI